MDRWAARSHQLAAKATDEGRLAEEIVSVTVKSRKAETVVEADEAIRPDSTRRDAGEAAGDRRRRRHPHRRQRAGRQRRRRRGGRRLRGVGAGQRPRAARPGARLRHVADDFAYLAKTPAKAAQQALEKLGKSADEIDLWEINEAFASVALNSLRMLGVDEDKVNVNGGAIALGHPIGASGARIVGALVHELRRRGGGLGCAAICSGGGQGDAIILEVNGALGACRAQAAFFDLDRTLIAGSSGLPWARAATKAGLISRRQMARWGVDALRFRLRGSTDEATEKLLGEIKQVFHGRARRARSRGMAPEVLVGVLPRIYPEMLEEVYAHQDAGRPTFIVSAAGDELVQLLARILYMDGGIGTAYEVGDDGLFTGELGGAVHVRRGQGRGDAPVRRRARDRPRARPTPTPTRPPTCRCCARSATRWSSTPTRS